MKAVEQYFHVVLFIMLYKVVLTFKSVDESVHELQFFWECREYICRCHDTENNKT